MSIVLPLTKSLQHHLRSPLALAGLVTAALLTLLAANWSVGSLKGFWYLLFSASLAAIAFTVAARRSQTRVLAADEFGLRYQVQGMGSAMQIAWQNVQRFGTPSVDTSTRREFSCIGIKLRDYHEFLQHCSLRAARWQIHLMRPLLAQAYKDMCRSGYCGHDDPFADEDIWTDVKGRRYRGILGGLANKMSRLRQAYGYDLYLPIADDAIEKRQILDLLNQAQQQHWRSLNENS